MPVAMLGVFACVVVEWNPCSGGIVRLEADHGCRAGLA